MINVMYSGNRGVLDGLLISLSSLCARTTQSVCVYVLTMDLTDVNKKYTPITEADAESICRILKSKNDQSSVSLLDCREIYLKYLQHSPNAENSYTPYALLRLLSDRIDEIPDKILYLDTDTVIVGDIEELYDIDVDNYEYAAVRDYIGKFFFGFGYINSGVMLLNMKKIRESGMFSRATQLCAEKKIFLADQSAINSCTQSRLLLNRRFNEQKRCFENTVIRHFSMTVKWLPYFHTQNIKPWHPDRIKKYLYKYDYKRVEPFLNEYGNRNEEKCDKEK
ncbi:MAG: glycosyltransferase [Eubacteriales bacterium]|nr:glycosyltransferase [Eubacteriales bacterium]